MDKYDQTEVNLFVKELREVELSPLMYRKEGKEKYRKVLTEFLPHFENLIDYLVSGDYSRGSKVSFKQMSKRNNRAAWLFNMLGMLEFKTSNKYARELWHELDTDLQAAVNRIIEERIARFDGAQEEEKQDIISA